MKSSQSESIAHNITFHPKQRLNLFLDLPHQERTAVLPYLSKQVTKKLTCHLPEKDLIDLLEHLDPDQGTDILQYLPARKHKKILTQINTHLQKQISFLSEFDPDTAAGLMNLDYIQIEEQKTIKEAAEKFKKHEQLSGKPPIIIIMKNGTVMGQLPGHALGLGSKKDLVGSFSKPVKTISGTTTRKEMVSVFKTKKQNKLIVINEEGTVLGIVFADTLLKYIDEEATQSLYRFAGINEEESVLDPARTKIRLRYKWLMLNLLTAFFAASIVSLFQETIAAYVLLAVYMPIVAGMGGNAGTQTLAVLIRGITLKQINLKTAWPTLKREVIAGFTNGLLNGVIVGCIVWFAHQDLLIAVILGLAMISNLIISAIFGTIVPLIMSRLGKDPATSATIFITTATDVLGFSIFLGLATLLLN